MMSSLLLALALAQPVVQPAAPTPGASPGSSGPAEPAPTEPTPSTPTGPAEAAPSEAQPTPTPTSTSTPNPIPGPGSAASPPRSPAAPAAALETTAQAPSNTASLLGGLAYRPGNALPPVTGFSIAGAFHRRYATLPADLQLGWEVDFAFDRFSMSVVGTEPGFTSGTPTTFPGARTITATSFDALQTLSAHAGSSRLWLGAGGGLSIGFLSTSEAELGFGTATSYQPFARAAAGADLAFDQQTGVQLRVGYAHMLTSSRVASGGQSWELIGDLLDIHAGLFYRFR